MISILAFLFPAAAGTAVSVSVKEEKARNRLYAAVMILTDLLGVLAMKAGGSVTAAKLSERASLSFGLDRLGMYAMAAVLILYTAVCFYAFEYMKKEERVNLFFACFFISLGAMMAVCMSENLVTLYFAFELATLSTVPLVLHEMTKDAMTAGMKYLFYSIGGALLGLLAVFFIYSASTGDGTFVMGGFLDEGLAAAQGTALLAAIMAGIIGFGTKAGMYPMHGWLPSAHPIAPAPASSLLSGIIAKAGVVAVIRLVYYSVGADFLRGTWVQRTWMILAMLTVLMGSTMAFREKVTKKRLAYSTISQISYIMLALSLLSDEGLRGGLMQMMSHMAAKGCLFLAAGVFICILGSHHVDELRGVGRKIPVTMWCFLFASLSLIGIPPMGGFVSKWVIAGAALSAEDGIWSILAPVVLLISALLTAGYLLPVVINAFFPGKEFEEVLEEQEDADHSGKERKQKEPLLMVLPMIALCLTALAMGIFGVGIVGRVIP